MPLPVLPSPKSHAYVSGPSRSSAFVALQLTVSSEVDVEKNAIGGVNTMHDAPLAPTRLVNAVLSSCFWNTASGFVCNDNNSYGSCRRSYNSSSPVECFTYFHHVVRTHL